ncbi:MAG: hypothetical protein SF069_06810 [Phycisphaerae bacterium]|nr:hypothetical protein [Phycisphaerae bacterium]
MSAVAALLLALVGSAESDEFIRALREGFNGENDGQSARNLAIGAVIVLTLLAVLARVFRGDQGRVDPPPDLLAGAAEELGLTDADRRDLEQVARAIRAPQPIVLLLSPANLKRALEAGDFRKRDPSLCDRLNDLTQLIHGRALWPPRSKVDVKDIDPIRRG